VQRVLTCVVKLFVCVTHWLGAQPMLRSLHCTYHNLQTLRRSPSHVLMPTYASLHCLQASLAQAGQTTSRQPLLVWTARTASAAFLQAAHTPVVCWWAAHSDVGVQMVQVRFGPPGCVCDISCGVKSCGIILNCQFQMPLCIEHHNTKYIVVVATSDTPNAP
jgi:hypothetical protein